ncbi:hypothetical protein M885DRAFT_576187 [Pelagophyceae sp. CCMP2097]|nr:hypothetical protein M885DRAFT_576187 [Pelagophyceae sp. CCMP2097]
MVWTAAPTVLLIAALTAVSFSYAPKSLIVRKLSAEPPWSGCGAVKRWASAPRQDWREAFWVEMSHSQFGQDVVVISLVHALSRGGDNATPTLSGPFHYDTCLGWKGLCVEPNPQYHAKIRAARTCPLVDACVSDEARQVELLATGSVGHIAHRRLISMRCTTLRSILVRHWRVTYLSLDVEGHELPVLQGADWNRTAIDFITLENEKAAHVDYLRSRGLAPLACVGIDTLFARIPLFAAARVWFDVNEAALSPLCVDRDVSRCRDGDARGHNLSL